MISKPSGRLPKSTSVANTSGSTPLKVSWIVYSTPSEDDSVSATSFALRNQVKKSEKKPLFGMCSAPGKVLKLGRDGKSYSRSLADDIKHFRLEEGVDVILCLLNRYELRIIGVDITEYQVLCKAAGITLVEYPIVEMASPEDSPAVFEEKIVSFIVGQIMAGKRVICHCRGGIGRAGTIASCVILKMKLAAEADDAIKSVRALRDPRCVESRKQEDYINRYHKYLVTVNQIP
jgi:protein-tyrosine phosphatase